MQQDPQHCCIEIHGRLLLFHRHKYVKEHNSSDYNFVCNNKNVDIIMNNDMNMWIEDSSYLLDIVFIYVNINRNGICENSRVIMT
mmetsp:Transcript_28169/g.45349  ORF Transcript_28169/g.45349 Transcript_28169/m.45349 type:complete len:85 (+) Transcript_28169:622-876(+)